MQIFASLEVNWCTEAVWIIVMFLSAVWILHSDGTHSLVSTGEQGMECYIFTTLYNLSITIPLSY